jgi:hypothetical protein
MFSMSHYKGPMFCGICRTWILPLEILEPPQILIPYIQFSDFVKGTFVKILEEIGTISPL